MELFSRFKKHYTHYLLGIIIPAMINGVSVPLLKRWIGAADYGEYALYFNALLITNVLISGWLSQSILRFNARAADKVLFAAQSFFISLLFPILCFVPAVMLVWHQQGSFLFGILFSATLLLASVQLPLQSQMQANFRSKTILLAEAIRTISWLGTAVVFLWLQLPFLYSLFMALFLSYSLSIGFLYKKSLLPAFQPAGFLPTGWARQMRQLLSFGLPLSVWFAFTYLMSYIDKVYMLWQFGAEMQGNYQAMFDMVSKGLVLLLAPVLTAAAPLLSEAYEKGEKRVIKTLLRKLIFYEILILAAVLLTYQVIGYKLLFFVLSVPVRAIYIQMGAWMIAGTLVWQVALLAQKPFELKLQSTIMPVRAAIAVGGQFLFYVLSRHSLNPAVIPAGYYLSAVIYLLLTVYPLFKKGILKPGHQPGIHN